jgi:uncharacterized protein YndB with AHSA1/START domain
MPELPFDLDRTVVINAKPETVFNYFTDSDRWARWWGAGSTIDPQPGGKVYIRYPNNAEASGEVLEIRHSDLIVFTWGFPSGNPIPPGSSRVTIRLEPVEQGTRLHLHHEFAEAAARDQHIQGWRYQLSLFANVVANEAFSHAANAIDTWFDAWVITDDKLREESFTRIAAPEIRFHDRNSLLEGLVDLAAHSGAAQRFMPGIRLRRKGDIRQCQGTVLANWTAVDATENELMSGTSVFVFRADGKIVSATGFTQT